MNAVAAAGPGPGRDSGSSLDGLAAIILAGGRSTRMGSDKASLRVGGVSLLELAVRRASAVAQPLVVSARAGQCLPSFELPYTRVDDPPLAPAEAAAHDAKGKPPGGPLVGIHQALLALVGHGARWALVLAVDDVGLSEATLRLRANLALTVADASSTWALMGLDDDGHPQPLAAVVRVGAGLERAREALAHGIYAPRRWLSGEGVTRVPAAQFGATHDVDTPEAWARHLATRSDS